VTLPPAGGEIYIWRLRQGAGAWPSGSPDDVLSDDERDRAARFLAAEARARFVAGRIVARDVLGRYLQTAPAAIAFAYSATGKPRLGGDHDGCGLHFSLSHAGDVVMLAVARDSPVGIDVEHMLPGRFLPALVARVFTAAERDEIAASTDPEGTCYRLWVRKEACVKASGEGIAAGLSSLDVLGERCRDGRGHDAGMPVWRIADLPMPESYVAAVAIGGSDPTPLVREWRRER
jgi:4'-phosphopantetheinyl transferase